MKEVFIIRKKEEKQTIGELTYTDINANIYKAKTLELPDKQNESGKSCIPEGDYICKWTRSERFSKLANEKIKKQTGAYPVPLIDVFKYEVTKVKDRAGIRIHSVNYSRDLRGCIALGSQFKDIDIDGQMDIIHSGDTVKKFEELMNKEDFLLHITC